MKSLRLVYVALGFLLASQVPQAVAGQGSSCLNGVSSNLTREQMDILKPLLASGALRSDWTSAKGTAFTLSQSGPLMITVKALPPSAIEKLARTANETPGRIQFALNAGMISFNATLCEKNGGYAIALRGTGATAGKSGYFTLKPNSSGSFVASGQIAGTPINEAFAAR